MREGSESDFEISAETFGLIKNHHRMQAGIDLRVPFFGLRYAEQCVDFREKAL